MKMATEVSVRVRDSNLGQAFFVKQEEWDLCLSEIRAILVAQEVETPSQFRFLTGNGNVVSTTLEDTVVFRDVVENEPFAEIKKEDTSLHSAEERVTPQITIVSYGSSASQESEEQCPFINKFPIFAGVRGTLPCMRNLFKIQTLLKIAFILTCLLFLMIFILTLFLHLLFGIGTVGGLAGHGFLGASTLQQQTASSSFDLDALKVKIAEVEIENRFEIQHLKQKLSEFEDMNLSLFKELEAAKNKLAAVTVTQTNSGNRLDEQISDLSLQVSETRELYTRVLEEALNPSRIDERVERMILKVKTTSDTESEALSCAEDDVNIGQESVNEEVTDECLEEERVVNEENKGESEVGGETMEEENAVKRMEGKEEIEREEAKQQEKFEERTENKDLKESKKEKKLKKEKKNEEEKKKNKEDKKKNKEGKKKNKGKDKKKEKKNKK